MMKLYWCPRSRSFSALWLMEEIGEPYERVLIDITTGAQKTPEYLAINPMGKVPALEDGDVTVAEASAICAYVAERHHDKNLAPPIGDPLRAKYLQWLFFSPGCIEPAMIEIFTKISVPTSTAAWGSATQVFDVLDAALEKGPFLLGRDVLGGRHHDRLGTEFRDAAFQDGSGAAVVRPLHRCLRGAAGIPARDNTRGGVRGRIQSSGLSASAFSASGCGIEIML